ncbi:MAG: hypothetical protein HY890_00085 [Deltaproteobacteria bacterium]|nr:hypothetical protein [Deltaproteobacteria bacterium]
MITTIIIPPQATADLGHFYCTYEPYNYYGILQYRPTIHNDLWNCAGYAGHGETHVGYRIMPAVYGCGEEPICHNICISHGYDWWEYASQTEAASTTKNCYGTCRPDLQEV